MALTAYQLQFRQRMKRTINLRAAADQKARAYARLLAAALSDAAKAADMMNQLNQSYNVDVSPQTLLVHSLLDQVSPQLLTDMLAESQPGEEEVLFNQVPDANGGQPLPNQAVFGELVPLVVTQTDQAKAVVKPAKSARVVATDKPIEPVVTEPSASEQTMTEE